MSCHPSETVPMLHHRFGVAFRVIVVFAVCFDNRASEPTDKGAPRAPPFLSFTPPLPLLPRRAPLPFRCCQFLLARSLARTSFVFFSPPPPPSSLRSIHPSCLPSSLRRAVAAPSVRRRKRRKKEPRVQRMKNGRHEQGDRHAHAVQRVVAAEVCASCHREV